LVLFALVEYTTFFDDMINFFVSDWGVDDWWVKKSCSTPWWETLTHGQQTTAYQYLVVWSDWVCRSQKRVCNNGILSGSYAFATCQKKQQTWTVFVPSPAFRLAPKQREVNFSLPQASQYTQPLTNFVTAPNDTVPLRRYLQARPPQKWYIYVALDNSQTFREDRFKWSTNQFDDAVPPIWEQYFGDDRFIEFDRIQQSVSIWPILWSQPQKTCTAPDGTIMIHGQQKIFYKQSQAYLPHSCLYQKRTCYQWILNGSYTQPTCQQIFASYNDIVNGLEPYAVRVLYDQNSFPSAIHRFPNQSSSVSSEWSCVSPRWGIVYDGESVIAFESLFPDAWWCRFEYRECRQGKLSWSYLNKICIND
jgi:hypothetical protein